MATTTTDDCVVSERLESDLSDLKWERITATGEAIATQVSVLSLLQHEALRIETRFGSQHPRTVQLKARLRGNLQVLRTLEVERQLAEIDVPETVEDGALIHGRIVDEDGLGIDRLSVALVDRSGAPTRDTREPVTDASGYFAIPLDPKTVDRLVRSYPEGIFLALFTPRRRLVHQQAKPLTPARRARLETEITLDRATLTATPSTTIVMPNLIGMTESEAVEVLQEVGLTLASRTTKVVPDQVGRILDQGPAGGTKVELGSSISLVIGVQSNTIKVPSVIGRELKDAQEEINKLDLILGKISGASPSDKGIVSDQDPRPEVEIPPGTAVNDVVAPSARNEIKEVLERIAADEGFVEIGISVSKLENRLRKSIDTKGQLASLLEGSDQALKSSLGLRNLNVARAFKRVLRKVLEEN